MTRAIGHFCDQLWDLPKKTFLNPQSLQYKCPPSPHTHTQHTTHYAICLAIMTHREYQTFCIGSAWSSGGSVKTKDGQHLLEGLDKHICLLQIPNPKASTNYFSKKKTLLSPNSSDFCCLFWYFSPVLWVGGFAMKWGLPTNVYGFTKPRLVWSCMSVFTST